MADPEAQQLRARQRDKLRELRHTGFLSDFIVECEGREFNVHRGILWTTSPYFEDLFACHSDETEQGRLVVHDMTADSVSTVLDFVYSCGLNLVDPDSVDVRLDVIRAAHHLQVESLYDHLWRELQRNQKWMGQRFATIWNVADACNDDKMANRTLRFIVKHISVLADTAETFRMDFLQIRRLCQRLESRVQPQGTGGASEDASKATSQVVRCWLEHGGRLVKERVEQVLSFIGNESLDMPLNQDLVATNDQFLQRLVSLFVVKQQIATPDDDATHSDDSDDGDDTIDAEINSSSIYSISNYSNAFAFVSNTTFPALVCFGTDVGLYSRTQVTRYSNKAWSTSVKVPVALDDGVAVVGRGDDIYFIGGEEVLAGKLRSVVRYNYVTNLTYAHDCWTTKKTHVGVAILNGFVYVVGGRGRFNIATTEVLRFRPEKLTLLPPVPLQQVAATKREHVSARVVAATGHLFVVGCNQCDEVEEYDPAIDTWTVVGRTPLPSSVDYPRVTSDGETIYALYEDNSAFSFSPRKTTDWIRMDLTGGPADDDAAAQYHGMWAVGPGELLVADRNKSIYMFVIGEDENGSGGSAAGVWQRLSEPEPTGLWDWKQTAVLLH